jgi:hypothetical protein
LVFIIFDQGGCFVFHQVPACHLVSR